MLFQKTANLIPIDMNQFLKIQISEKLFLKSKKVREKQYSKNCKISNQFPAVCAHRHGPGVHGEYRRFFTGKQVYCIFVISGSALAPRAACRDLLIIYSDMLLFLNNEKSE